MRGERGVTLNLPAFLSWPLSLLLLPCDSSPNSALTSAAVGILLNVANTSETGYVRDSGTDIEMATTSKRNKI